MGIKADEALDLDLDGLRNYLYANHSIYMDAEGSSYYLTDANDRYYRVQRTDQLNEKGHYTDCSELVPTMSEFLSLPFKDGKSIADLLGSATFFASVKA